MSLTTVRIHYTISQRLSGAMEDCSIVRIQQLRTSVWFNWLITLDTDSPHIYVLRVGFWGELTVNLLDNAAHYCVHYYSHH